MGKDRLKILLIEDDEDDYLLVRSLISKAFPLSPALDWVRTYEAALEELHLCRHDVYLLDYCLGLRTGMDLLREAQANGCKAPIILLTGQGHYEVDLDAMRAGAADYLIKGQINGDVLERSIRYAKERKRSEQALRESEGHLKFLSSQLLTIQEVERKRIAGELHDNLGQILSAIKFGVENILNRIDQGSVTARYLEPMVPLAQYAIEEVRKLYTQLRPTILDDFGAIAAIGWYVREFEKLHPSIYIEVEMQVEESDVADALKIVIYRIVQEALGNIAGHSKAELVSLSLSKIEGTLQLAIEDNGVGFDPTYALSARNPARGLGLTSMKERTELSGGAFSIESVPDQGTTIRATWPIG